MTMLRVAVITKYFPSSGLPTHGRSAYQTLRRLAPHAEVRVFYPHANYPSWLKPRTRTYGKLDLNFSPPDVKATYHNYFALPALTRPINGFMATRAILPHVRAFRPDLILSYFLYPDGYIALKIGKTLSVPVFAYSIGSDLNNIADPASAMHTRTVLQQADAILGVSADLRLKAIAMGAPADRTHAILNGCDISVFHPRDRAQARAQLGLDSHAEAVVYIGRMDLTKGLRELVEAAVSLHQSRPRMKVYIVGDGHQRDLVDQAIASRNAAAYVHALDGCSFDDVALWIAASDLVTLPSYMEGCPNVVLEALAAGRPVVATHVGGIPELMDDSCGRLVPPRDAAALATALAQVLDTPWDANALSAQHSRSWDAVAGDLLELFQSQLRRQSPAAQAARP
jgi:glycosyltransferase involved in cell wall biosynthesis